MNAREAARWVRDELELAAIEDAPIEAEVLVRWAGGLTRSEFFTAKEIACERLPLVGIALKQRLERQPLAYITGEREFYGRMFAVTPSVLVPRPETELLVELALAELQVSPGSVIDVGTGSGCIAVSIACERPGAQVIATDISTAALAVARANAGRHAATVEFVRGSLLTGVSNARIVVANLPYIPTSTIATLDSEVRDCEPRLALDGGPDGLRLIRALIEDCATRVRPGLLVLEVAAGQASEVEALLRFAGAEPAVHRDLAGIERVVCGRWP